LLHQWGGIDFTEAACLSQRIQREDCALQCRVLLDLIHTTSATWLSGVYTRAADFQGCRKKFLHLRIESLVLFVHCFVEGSQR